MDTITASNTSPPIVVYLDTSALESPHLEQQLSCPDGTYCKRKRVPSITPDGPAGVDDDDEGEELGPIGGEQDMQDAQQDVRLTDALMDALPETEKRHLDEFIIDTEEDTRDDVSAHRDMLALAAYSLFNEQSTLQQRLDVLSRKYEAIRIVGHDFTLFFTQLLMQMHVVHTNKHLLNTVAGRCTSCILSDYVQYGPLFMGNTPRPNSASRSLASLKQHIKTFLDAKHLEDGSTIDLLKTHLTNIFYDFIHVVQYMPYGYSDVSKNNLVAKLVLICLPYITLHGGKRLVQTDIFANNKEVWTHSIEYSMYQGVYDYSHVETKDYPFDSVLQACCRRVTIDLHKNHVLLSVRFATPKDNDAIAVETLNAPSPFLTTIIVHDDVADKPLAAASVFYRWDYTQAPAAIPPVACIGSMINLLCESSATPEKLFSLYKLLLMPVFSMCVEGVVSSVVYTVNVPRSQVVESSTFCASWGCTFYPNVTKYKSASVTAGTILYNAWWSAQDEAAMIMYRLHQGVFETCGGCVVAMYKEYYDSAAAMADTEPLLDYFTCAFGCENDQSLTIGVDQSPASTTSKKQKKYYTHAQEMERHELAASIAEHKKTIMKQLYK